MALGDPEVPEVVGNAVDRVQQRRNAVRWVVYDLLALQNEFPELVIAIDRKSVAVCTEAITLAGVCLGRYKIELFFSDKSSLPFYSVRSLDSTRSAHEDGVTHPHVCNERLCEGEATTPLWQAIRDCRLLDAFLIMAQVLRTYNEGNSYLSLDHWNWQHCSDCGDLVASDQLSDCDHCGDSICSSCFADHEAELSSDSGD